MLTCTPCCSRTDYAYWPPAYRTFLRQRAAGAPRYVRCTRASLGCAVAPQVLLVLLYEPCSKTSCVDDEPCVDLPPDPNDLFAPVFEAAAAELGDEIPLARINGMPQRARALDERGPGRSVTHTPEPYLGQAIWCRALSSSTAPWNLSATAKPLLRLVEREGFAARVRRSWWSSGTGATTDSVGRAYRHRRSW